MRESIGATWIFSLCLTFIVIFTAYIAVSVNYSKAFRLKSYIVTKIEENEGLNTNNLPEDLSNYLIYQGYNVHGKCKSTYQSTNGNNTDDASWELVSEGCIGEQTGTGKCLACVYEKQVSACNQANVGNNDINAKQSYYRVVTFFNFDLPVINSLLTFEVSGESKLVYDIKSCS